MVASHCTKNSEGPTLGELLGVFDGDTLDSTEGNILGEIDPTLVLELHSDCLVLLLGIQWVRRKILDIIIVNDMLPLLVVFDGDTLDSTEGNILGEIDPTLVLELHSDCLVLLLGIQ